MLLYHQEIKVYKIKIIFIEYRKLYDYEDYSDVVSIFSLSFFPRKFHDAMFRTALNPLKLLGKSEFYPSHYPILKSSSILQNFQNPLKLRHIILPILNHESVTEGEVSTLKSICSFRVSIFFLATPRFLKRLLNVTSISIAEVNI